jgi:hypothetical protein
VIWGDRVMSKEEEGRFGMVEYIYVSRMVGRHGPIGAGMRLVE